MNKKTPFTAADLKRSVEASGHDSYFFERDTMKFFRDTMANYYVRAKPVTVKTYDGTEYSCWELTRVRPVKHGVTASAFFDTVTFRRITPAK